MVRQYDRTDCGPASLLTVLRYWGGNTSLVSVRELAGTGINGTSLWSLGEAAKRLGLSATGAKGSYDDLRAEQLPCIAHITTEEGLPHFAVVFAVESKKVLLGDPARGLRWVTREVFQQMWQSGAVLLVTPTKDLIRSPTPHWVRWIFNYFMAEETWLTQALFTGCTYSILGLSTALFVRFLIDDVIPRNDVQNVVVVGAFLLGLLLLRAAVGYLRGRLLIELSRRVNTNLTVHTIHHLFKLPASFFESRRTGDITARINDSVGIHAAMLNAIGNTAIDGVAVFGSMIALFVLTHQFGWIAFAFFPILLAILLLSVGVVRRHQHVTKQSFAGVQASYVDSVSAIDAIRSTNSTSGFSNLLCSLYDRFQRNLASLGLVQIRISTAIEVIAACMIVATLVGGSLYVVHGDMTLGTMMAGYSLLVGAVPSIARIVDTSLQVQDAAVASARLRDLILVDPECSTGEKPFHCSRGLSLRDGTFYWRNGEKLLDRINLEIPIGRLTAICGPSGIGKSTLIKILDRRYSPTEGVVLVDETPSSEIDLSSFRQRVATLPESVSIINGTIAANILLGRGALDEVSIVNRIRKLGFAHFLKRFSHGLSTLLGEDGRQISSGERQTIGLIRALWEEPDILLVDEGMNAVDMVTAQLFAKTLSAYSKTHAVLVVSHQPRTLLLADYIYLLGPSGIEEQGSPQDLVNQETNFAAMVRSDRIARRTA